MAFYSIALTIAAITPAPSLGRKRNDSYKSSSAAYTALVPNRFKGFWRE
jgi:hypothetical protein